MIQFYRGLRSSYDYPTNTKLQDAIFFATDTGELLVNGVNYGIDSQKIEDVQFDETTGILTFTKGDGSTLQVDGLKFTSNYETNLDPELATLTAIGGIPAGTQVKKYKDKPLSNVIDDLLFPTIQPTAVAPKVTLSLKSGQNSVREIGSNSPVVSNFTTSWDAGSIKIGNSVQATRAGEKQSDVIYRGVEANVVNDEPTKVTKGATQYYYKVYYSKGPDPKDSKGNAASSLVALPEGSIVSSAVTINGVYPFYANTTTDNIANGTVTKLALTNSTSFTTTLAGESATVKHTFKLPHLITKIELKDPFGNWVAQKLEEFPKTTENIDVNGTSVEYNVYTRNQGQNGATEFKITYSK